MNFIKKIFDRNVDESVHLQFQKFSKGEFRNRALIKAKNSAGKYTISTTAEFANEMVKEVAEKLGSNRTAISGALITTLDLKGQLDYKTIKQFMGVKQYQIDKEMSGKEILEMINKFPKAFLALSFKAGDSELKIKAKAPKSAKPSTKSAEDSKPNPNFCKLITSDNALANSFIFETDDWKNALVTHHFIITDIIIPTELKNEKDFAIIREKSRRKGKIIREAEIDGKKIIKEIPLEA